MERFIESPSFPIDTINKFSALEKQGGGRPDFWEMVFWWTRKPLISARAIITASLLPFDYNVLDFKRIVKLLTISKTPHKENPSIPPQLKEYFSRVKLLDPFAGFGSIPLEGVRLGLGEVVAVELLPTAYVFLKAVLEHPKVFGENLIRDVEYWGKWVMDNLKNDPDVKELYDDDTAVYIGSWEVKCPYCGNYTPLVGNWWLARVSKKTGENEEESGVKTGVFTRLAWMEPYKVMDRVGVRVVDLNKELGLKEIKAKVNAKQGVVETLSKTYSVPKANIDARRETATCLICNNVIKRRERRETWYVKKALREYNEALERYLRGEISLEKLKTSNAKPKTLVKVRITGKTLEFQPATQEDNEKLWKALEKLREMWGDPDIPTEALPSYDQEFARTHIWGFDKWFKLFNPRQLLVLVKLVKLIREAGKRVEEEKLRQGWEKQKAHKYAEAVTTYLATALVNHIRHNCLVTSIEPTQKFVAHALAFRGIAMTWNWVEERSNSDVIGSFTRSLKTNIESLQYLVTAVSSSLSRVGVVLDDASVLNRVGVDGFDLIVTDPPYRDDVAYAELSDFYFVWLKRVLSDVGEVFGVRRLVPRFYREAFFDDLGNVFETQWRCFASREVSENPGRFRFFNVGVDSLTRFKDLLKDSFNAMASKLKDDGLLVTYYAHTSPDAWEALLEAGWLNAKLRITASYAVATESVESVVARGKVRLDMAIVAVWRKGVYGRALVDEVYAEAVNACSLDAYTYRRAGFEGVNLFVAVLGRVLSHFTKYEHLVGFKNAGGSVVKELVEKYVYPATAEAIARSYGASSAKLSPFSMFYLLAKVLVGRRARRSRRVLDRTTTVVLSIGTRSSIEDLKRMRIVSREKEDHVLLEPKWGARDLREAVEDVLLAKNLDPREPRLATSIDALHLLEYYAVSLSKEEVRRRAEDIKARAPALYDEALSLALMLVQGLPREDPESELVKRVLDSLDIGVPGTIEFFSKR